MTPIDEMTAVEAAWMLFKKINELHDLLWGCYYKEFLQIEHQEKMRRLDDEANLPF